MWIILGLVGFAVTFLNGILVLKPKSEEMAAEMEKEGADIASLIPRIDGLMRFARLDYLAMWLVVVTMVLKPTTEDTAVLVAMAVVLVVGAAILLRKPKT